MISDTSGGRYPDPYPNLFGLFNYIFYIPYAFNIPGFFSQSMNPTFDTPGDIMPADRTKYIHTLGVVGKVKFVKNGANTYSGIFKGQVKD